MEVAVPVLVSSLLSVASSLLTPTQKSINGTQIENRNPTAEFGVPMPQPYGFQKIESCPMDWAIALEEVKTNTPSSGQGGKGGGGGSTETISYYMTARYNIGLEISTIRKVWLNGTLVFDSESTDERSNKFRDSTEFYFGTNNQSPSPTIEAIEGAGNVSRHKGISSIVFNRYPISEFNGSGFPKVDVLVIGKLGQVPRVSDVINNVCELAGIAPQAIDTTALLGDVIVKGCSLKNDGSPYKDLLDELQQMFGIISLEVGDKIYFTKQESETNIVEIPTTSLRARPSGDSIIPLFEKTEIHYRELPSEVQVTFPNIDNDLSNGRQAIKDRAATHFNQMSINTSIVTSDSVAVTAANRMLYQSKIQSVSYNQIFLLPEYNYLQVGGLIAITDPETNRAQILQISKKNSGTNFLIELETKRFSARYITSTSSIQNVTVTDSAAPINLSQTNLLGVIVRNGSQTLIENVDYSVDLTTGIITPISGGAIQNGDELDIIPSVPTSGATDPTEFNPPIVVENPYTPTTPQEYGSAEVIPLDLPLLSDDHTDRGVYIAVKGDNLWRKGTLFVSQDNGTSWVNLISLIDTSVTGKVISVIPDCPTALVDKITTIRVELESGIELDPATTSDFWAGKSLGLFGDEIIAFKNATLISNSPITYDLDYLVRGAKGTENETGNHALNERFVLLSGYLERIDSTSIPINTILQFKAVGQGVLEPNVATIANLTVTGEALKPYPPSPISTQKIGDDWLINWYRRTRKNGNLTDYIDVSYNEGETDNYIVEFYDNSDVLIKSYTFSGTSFVYTSVMQIADFGSIQSDLMLRLSQVSSLPISAKYSPFFDT